MANGGSLPFVGLTSYEITVKDAAGKEVGTATASSASGTTALDLDLRKLDADQAKAAQRFAELSFGGWTVEVGAVGTLVPPIDTGQVDDVAQKRFVTTLDLGLRRAAEALQGGGAVRPRSAPRSTASRTTRPPAPPSRPTPSSPTSARCPTAPSATAAPSGGWPPPSVRRPAAGMSPSSPPPRSPHR